MTGPKVEAVCRAIYAFEVGHAIDLVHATARLGPPSQRSSRPGRRAPASFEYRPAPLRVPVDPPNESVAALPVERAELALYDFGAASVTFSLPFSGPLDELIAVSDRLDRNETLALEARFRIGEVVARLGDAVTRPAVADLVEDYLVFELVRIDPDANPRRLATDWSDSIARILRSEARPLAPEEVADAVSHRLSFGTDDLTLVDWNAAVVFDPEPEETRLVLEFANVQLLELRHLDAALDRILDQAYGAVTQAERGFLRTLRPPVSALRGLGELQMDAAILFERVTNALKLIGDQFLSRLYTMVSSRFHFADWDRTIGRKLEVLDGVYQKLGDRVTARRLEVLEWIVIGLIALEIVLSLLGR
jgi:hypothetical protein